MMNGDDDMSTMGNKPITVLGETKKVGDQAPDFKALNTKGEWVKLSDFKQKYVVLSVVPSLDTSVCSIQTKTVNSELTSRDDLVVITISNDLPMAQARWCGNEGLDHVVTLSDHVDLDFAHKYGTYMKEVRLQARSVFVLDEKRHVVYVEYLDEMSHHPNYDKLIDFVKHLPKA